MIKTTRIKYSQAPRIIVDDLSPQCDGVKQTFTLSRPVPEWAPYCLVFNGQLYTNTSYKQWFVLDADRKTIHTSFITPPTQGPNKSLILIVGVAGMEDLGVTWDDIVNKPEIPTEEVVDAKDAAVLEEAKEYADSIVPTVDVTKAYVDAQDADILAEAKAYTDEHSAGVSQQYVDQHDTATLNSAKSYTDAEVADTLQGAKDYADGVGTTTLASANAAISAAITQANVPVITLSNTDIAEGSALAANNFYGVYIEGSE